MHYLHVDLSLNALMESSIMHFFENNDERNEIKINMMEQTNVRTDKKQNLEGKMREETHKNLQILGS